MKIEGQRAELAPEVKSAETVSAAPRPATAPVPAPDTDRMQLSADAQLLARATQAARDLPDIRPEVVAEMREAIATGETGFDPLELADKMLDDLLEK